jgi:peroxiredoxin
MAVKVGEKAPALTLLSDKMEATAIPAAGETTVLVFFPAAFTGVCEKEVCSFRDAMATFNALAAKVYGISVDLPFSQAEFSTRNGLNFPLLSDHKEAAIAAYGVVDPSVLGTGIQTAKRSVFVVDGDGVVRYAWVSDDPLVEPDYEAVKKAVQDIG